MSPQKQCCVCHRILTGRSIRLGKEVWRRAKHPIPITHGICPLCLPAYLAKAAELNKRDAA